MTGEIIRKISFDQSVSSGIIGFHASIEYTDPTDVEADQLLKLLRSQEDIFRKAGYRVASDIEPKETKKKDA